MLAKCEPDDPRRCQYSDKNGQCVYLSEPNEDKCAKHLRKGWEERREIALYKLNIWDSRLKEMNENPQIKSIRNEIGILRITLEGILNRCNSTTDLVINAQRIADLAVKIEKLVTSCDRLEHKMGLMLDKSAALSFASQIVDIVSTRIEDPEIVELISNDIIEALAALTGSK